MKNTAPTRPKTEKTWQRWLPWVLTGIMALWIASGLRTARNKTPFHIEEFSQMPVLLNGRIQPWDSVAKNTLLIIRGKSKVLVTDRPQEELSFMEKAKLKKMTAMEWLLEAMTRPEEADKRHIFRIGIEKDGRGHSGAIINNVSLNSYRKRSRTSKKDFYR